MTALRALDEVLDDMNFRNTFTRSLLAAFSLLIGTQAFADRTTTYYHTDGLGSVVAATNQAGQVLWRKDYAPFGAQIDTTPETERTSYTGKQHDDVTGLTYFGARYFDPEIGRFMGIDPVGFLESNPISFNRYAYANNNPYRFVDPDGRQSAEASCDETCEVQRSRQPLIQASRAVADVASKTGDVMEETYKAQMGGAVLFSALKLLRFRSLLSRDIKGLSGAEFEEYAAWKAGGATRLRFKAGGREFDGEVAGGTAWIQSTTNPDRFKDVAKFKSDMGSYLSIAKENGKTLEFHTNQSIPREIKEWLHSKRITYVEL